MRLLFTIGASKIVVSTCIYFMLREARRGRLMGGRGTRRGRCREKPKTGQVHSTFDDVMAAFDDAEDSAYYNATLLEHAPPTAFTTHPSPVLDGPTAVTTTPPFPYPKSIPATSPSVYLTELKLRGSSPEPLARRHLISLTRHISQLGVPPQTPLRNAHPLTRVHTTPHNWGVPPQTPPSASPFPHTTPHNWGVPPTPTTLMSSFPHTCTHRTP